MTLRISRTAAREAPLHVGKEVPREHAGQPYPVVPVEMSAQVDDPGG